MENSRRANLLTETGLAPTYHGNMQHRTLARDHDSLAEQVYAH